MYNLLKESFGRLYKNRTFRICFILVLAIPTLLTVIDKILTTQAGLKSNITADDYLFNMHGIMPLFIAIAAGLFIAKDFRQNTVRNKIICGYSRTQIYIANWITCVFIALLYHFASTIVTVAMTAALFETGDLFTTVNLYYFLISIPVLISFTSITMMMTMIFRSTAAAIFSYFIHQIVSLFDLIFMQLKDKEVRKFISLFLPQNQLQIINYRHYYDFSDIENDMGELFETTKYAIPEGFDAVAIPLYAVILIIVISALGILHFNKSDVK